LCSGPAGVNTHRCGPTGVNNHGCGPTGVNNHGCGPTDVNNHRCGPTGVNNHRCGPAGVNNHRCGPTGVNNHRCDLAGVREHQDKRTVVMEEDVIFTIIKILIAGLSTQRRPGTSKGGAALVRGGLTRVEGVPLGGGGAAPGRRGSGSQLSRSTGLWTQLSTTTSLYVTPLVLDDRLYVVKKDCTKRTLENFNPDVWLAAGKFVVIYNCHTIVSAVWWAECGRCGVMLCDAGERRWTAGARPALPHHSHSPAAPTLSPLPSPA
ncbi:hypothetical protein Hamer_G000854, partial [Homarus americanus]